MLVKLLNGRLDIYFYVTARQIIIQHLFGDNGSGHLASASVPIQHLGTTATKAFDKLLAGSGLSSSVANVVRNVSIGPEGAPAMQFLNACIQEFMRVDRKRQVDQGRVLEMLERKESARPVPRHDEMFYRDAFRLMPYIDYQQQSDRVHEALLQDIPDDEDEEEMKALDLMRLNAPPLTFSGTTAVKRKRGPAMEKYEAGHEVWVTKSPLKKAPGTESGYGGLSVPYRAERDFLNSPSGLSFHSGGGKQARLQHLRSSSKASPLKNFKIPAV